MWTTFQTHHHTCRVIRRNGRPKSHKTEKGTNRARVGTNRANLGTNPPRAGTNQRREPVVSGLEEGRAGHGRRGRSAKMTLVMARASTPSAACRSRAQRPDRYRQPPHPCRPSSALTSTHIGASAEPVQSLPYLFFFLLSTHGVLLAAPSLRPIEARRSSGISAP